jgi:hypothetical protein
VYEVLQMRFETRYDTWIVAVLIGAGLLELGLPPALYFGHVGRGAPLWVIFAGPLVMIVVMSVVFAATLPQYYEVRDEGLFIRQGRKKVLLPYAALRELRADTGVLSAPVFSMSRIYLSATPGGQWVLALAEQDRFLAEVRRRAPQLQGGTKRDAH